MTHEDFMRRAMVLAREAAAAGEIPVGAVVVRQDRIIGEGRNRREEKQSALSHAEIEAIEAACAREGSWRLDGCDLYVTLEPCPMCAGAILNARLRTVYYGATDEKMGAVGSKLQLFALPFDTEVTVRSGVCGEECAELLRAFFCRLRKTKRNGEDAR